MSSKIEIYCSKGDKIQIGEYIYTVTRINAINNIAYASRGGESTLTLYPRYFISGIAINITKERREK